MSPIKSPFCWVLALMLLNASCTEKFYPETDSDVSILVVDGRITNKSGPYEVRLFRTVDLISVDTLYPETGAKIILNDDLGNSELFQEIRPGVYQTVYNIIKGEVGQTYWIEIETTTGEKYESTPETIQPEIYIESIYGEESSLLQDDGSSVNAVKILMDAKSPNNQGNYLRWEYQESWEWRNPFYEPKTDNPSTKCYPYIISDNVFIFDGSRQDIKQFNHLTTSKVTENEVRLNYEYFIHLSLYSVTFNCYNFWKNIEESVQKNGGLYNIIPANSKGNICACDSDLPVLGYFEASSVDSQNTSFSIQDFSMKFASFPSDCNELRMALSRGYPDKSKYHIIDEYWEDRIHIFIVRQNYCYDCNVKYSPNKPSFWP